MGLIPVRTVHTPTLENKKSNGLLPTASHLPEAWWHRSTCHDVSLSFIARMSLSGVPADDEENEIDYAVAQYKEQIKSK